MDPRSASREIHAAVKEAERYERLKIARRRGLLYVGIGLFFLGASLGNYSVGNATFGGSPFWYGAMFAGMAMMIAGGIIIAAAQHRKWKGIFDTPPHSLPWWARPADLSSMRKRIGHTLILLSFWIVILLGLFFLEPEPATMISLMAYQNLLTGAMLLACAMMVIVFGRQSRDQWLLNLGKGLALATIPFWFIALGPGTSLLLVGAYFGIPLVAMGLLRILGPARWMSQ